MTDLIKANIQDISHADGFRFSLSCSACGKTWVSTEIPFSGAGRRQTAHGRTVYEKEREAALSCAVSEASLLFESCFLCGEITCRECLEKLGDMTVCARCAERLKGKI